MEPESSDASHLPWIWYLECLASSQEVDYHTLRAVAKKVPRLSGSEAVFARELLALRCLEGLAAMGNEAVGASKSGAKIGLDSSQRCSIALFHITSEAVNSSSGLDGLDVSKWDIQSFIEHKRAQLPKCTLERLEERIVEGKDPAAVCLREISGIKIINQHDGTSYCQVAAGSEHITNSIPQNENKNGSFVDDIKDVLIQKALVGEGCHLEKQGGVQSNLKKSTEDNHVNDISPPVVPDDGITVPEQLGGASALEDNVVIVEHSSAQDVHSLGSTRNLSSNTSPVVATQTILGEDFREEIKSPAEQDVVEASRNDTGNEREPYKVEDRDCDVGGYHNEEVDVASCKNNFPSSRSAAFDWTEPVLCMKCNKDGLLLCCSSRFCSVAVHGDCLGMSPCFDDCGSFRCPFCASSVATAEYVEARSKAGIRKKELNSFLRSNLSSKLPQILLNRKKSMHLKQDDQPYPTKNHGNEEKIETNRDQANQNDHGDHISHGILRGANLNPTHQSPGVSVGIDLQGREIDDNPVVTDEPPILQAKDILPPKGKNKITICQPTDAISRRPIPSEGFDNKNSAIILYESDKWSYKIDPISQVPLDSEIMRAKPVSNITKVMTSKPFHVPYKSYPAHRRRKVPWTAEEEDKLKEGVRMFYNQEANVIPWGQILEFGALVFQPCRTAENLKDKWRNISKRGG